MDSEVEATATAIAPSNLAVIKYWGKRDVKLNLPINSSISVTLDRDVLGTTTSCAVSKSFQSDRLWLNGVEEEGAMQQNKRLSVVLREMRKLTPLHHLKDLPVHVVSKNSFPTAAGLASSAAGYACLVASLAQLYGIDVQSHGKELTRVARQGSGSASRSLFGGFVKWDMGKQADGQDSYAVQLAPETHWPDMEAIICVISDDKKTTSSTTGMVDSVNTSVLLEHRAKAVVPGRVTTMEKAIAERDFQTFAEITMKESNQFHATCLDTWPPIFYMNDTSRAVIGLVHELNGVEQDALKYAYTFDAGPNAVIFCMKENTQQLLDALLRTFHPSASDVRTDPDMAFVRGRTTLSAREARGRVDGKDIANSLFAGSVRYMYHTGVGEGARAFSGEEEKNISLIHPETGMPR